jgi:hypothetical protein
MRCLRDARGQLGRRELQLRQFIAYDTAGLPRGEMRGHALGRHLLGNGVIKRRIVADERDIELVALVAAACMRQAMERDFDLSPHVEVSTNVIFGTTRSRSIRHEALASRGVR